MDREFKKWRIIIVCNKSIAIDIIIVLCAGISKEGELPLWVLQRLGRAIDLYSDGVSNKILLSGKGRDNFPITEADAMKTVLLKKGIPSHDILTEELSKDTLQNAFFVELYI